MEVGLHDHGVCKSSKIQEGNKNTVDPTAADHGEKKANDDVSVDISDDNGRSRNGEGSKAEKLCRICHFGDDESSGDTQLISLGCDCRGELGFSHRSCAAVWFSQRGNRVCEICGKTAKNTNNNDNNNNNNNRNEGDSEMLGMEMNEMRMVIEAIENSSERNRRCKISFCNFLLGCLLLAFVLPWFFRGIDLL